MSEKKSCRGFSLIEIIVAIGVFSLFTMGIYSSIQFIFKVVYQSRIKIVESGIANEQIEIIRNIPFEQVGLVNGSPSGVLPATITATRNGLTFSITRTIRNIDDPFDGTIGGSPNDTAPADYKLVEVTVLCTSCNQTKPVILDTIVAPKYLEGDASKGTLFIRALNGSGQPVAGATVHVTASFPTSTIDITDVTNNTGLLALIDLPPGISKYNISVTKNGYTTEQTIVPSESNPNPTKPPASVIAKSVTEIGFMIDLISHINLETANLACQPIGTVTTVAKGTKRIGIDPDVYIVSSTIVTNGSGTYSLSNVIWDTYNFIPSGYDLVGSIPMLPLVLQPGVTQPVQVLLGGNTTHSLLVGARDSITLQPLASTTIRVIGSSYDQIKTTGVGHIRQTDWSGGSGQAVMSNDTRYFWDNGRIDNSNPTGSMTLKKVGGNYYVNGELESSTFDLGLFANYISLTWEPLSQPSQTGSNPVRFQIATSNSSTPASWIYRGPDGTTSTYYTATDSAINSIHNGDQYLRYKIYLQTADTSYTPTVSDMTVSFTNSCSPPGQAYFGGLLSEQYTVEITKFGYQTQSNTVTVSGDTRLVIDMTAN